MLYSDLKKIRAMCDDLTSSPNWREVVQNIVDDETDFTVDGVRFINDDSILDILVDELSSDEYVLGCFNADFLANVTGLPIIVFQSLQKAEAYTAIGEMIIALGKVRDLAEAYASADGYGHHFNSYDSSEDELHLSNGRFFHVFDTRS
jgi:hypothetical protein